jgi:peroxiredoxin Q/BCP
MSMLEKNQTAPDFNAVNQHDEKLTLSQFKGSQNVVLYFYPKDDTPGCTIEANEFTALASEFEQSDTVVLGVSKDSCEKHRKFIDKYGLEIDLISDASGDVCDKYQTWGEQQFMGKKYMGISRSTFVIDKAGLLVEAIYKVKAKGHAQQMLELVQTLC